MEVEKFKTLLETTGRIVKHHQQLSEARQEYYNMFSVFQIETRENKTHSAFITDLLNPKGAHRQGNVFLELFLEVVKPKLEQESTDEFKEKFPTKTFDTSNVFVKTEHTIDAINIYEKGDEEGANATGGRIDIFLRDKNGTMISIENKIHAIDQNKQIQRYYNYKTAKNTVFYLTLNGSEPSKKSKLKLISDKHFFNISYSNDITQWLELCLKEVPNFTALRETINQYIILIKKLTYTMNKEQQEELNEVMLSHMEEAEFIAQNYDKMVNKIRDNFRNRLIKELTASLNENFYEIKKGGDISKKYAQIWINLKSDPKPVFKFGVESFSGKGNINGDLFVGILNYKSPIIAALEDDNKISDIWRQVQRLKSKEGDNINLSNPYWVKVLSKPKSKEYTELFETFKAIILNFIKKYEGKLPEDLFNTTNQ